MINVGDKVVCPTGEGCGVEIIWSLDAIGTVIEKGQYTDGGRWYYVVWDEAEHWDYWVHWEHELKPYLGPEVDQEQIDQGDWEGYE